MPTNMFQLRKLFPTKPFNPFNTGPRLRAVFWNTDEHEKKILGLPEHEYNHVNVFDTETQRMEGLLTSVPPNHKSLNGLNAGCINTQVKFDGSKGIQTFSPFQFRRKIDESALFLLEEIIDNDYLDQPLHANAITRILGSPIDRMKKGEIIRRFLPSMDEQD